MELTKVKSRYSFRILYNIFHSFTYLINWGDGPAAPGEHLTPAVLILNMNTSERFSIILERNPIFFKKCTQTTVSLDCAKTSYQNLMKFSQNILKMLKLLL